MSSNFLQLFSTARNSLLKIFMKSPSPNQVLYEFEIQQIFGPVIIPKFTSKIILDIRKYKRKRLWTQKSVSYRKGKRKDTPSSHTSIICPQKLKLLLRERKFIGKLECPTKISQYQFPWPLLFGCIKDWSLQEKESTDC